MPVDFSTLSIGELRRRYLAPDRCLTRTVLRKLREDPRIGVRRLYPAARRRFDKQIREQRRLRAMHRLEECLWKAGYRSVAGVDEAGVGPLAGPVVAAAVVLRPHIFIDGIDDSKRLDPLRREELAEIIRACAAAIGLGSATVGEIDRLNVYWAAVLAMRRAVENLPCRPEQLLVDARRIPNLPIPQRPVVGGDRTHLSIAAASIIAKTHRDALMLELDREFPGYGFAKHKGYCTPQHQEALRRLGPSPVHRRSYPFVHEITGAYSTPFYDCQGRIKDISSLEDLAAVNQDLKALRVQLPFDEYRKLRLLYLRRRKSLPKAVQLPLL